MPNPPPPPRSPKWLNETNGSMLQCLLATEALSSYFRNLHWKREVNMDNPLGMGGRVAEAYAGLNDEVKGVSFGKLDVAQGAVAPLCVLDKYLCCIVMVMSPRSHTRGPKHAVDVCEGANNVDSSVV